MREKREHRGLLVARQVALHIPRRYRDGAVLYHPSADVLGRHRHHILASGILRHEFKDQECRIAVEGRLHIQQASMPGGLFSEHLELFQL